LGTGIYSHRNKSGWYTTAAALRRLAFVLSFSSGFFFLGGGREAELLVLGADWMHQVFVTFLITICFPFPRFLK
jgi:hypothetical protein